MGLCPFNAKAINAEKLLPSLPLLPLGDGDHSATATLPQPPQEVVPEDSTIPPVTPLKVYLRDHFTSVLQRSRPTRQHQKGQVKPRQYGEVLTADEV